MKRLLLCILALTLLIPAIPAAAGNEGLKVLKNVSTQSFKGEYDDIEGSWFQEFVERIGYPEIFGKSDRKFHPNKIITRMEFARLLHKALGININYFAPIDITDFYDDVKNSDAGSAQLYDLASLGIIDKKGSFEPSKQLDRDEMVHYAMLALKYAAGGEYAIIQVMPEPFGDDGRIRDEYKNSVYEAVVLKIVGGRGNNMFHPLEGATRAEAAAVIGRLLDAANSLPKSGQVVVKASAVETGGNLRMSLSITNNTDKTVVVNHSSGQKYDFALLDDKGDTLYRWSADKSFIMALTTTEIKAGEKVEFSETLDSAVYDPIKNKVKTFKAYITGTSESFAVNTGGY